jgi:glycosylphosphatidylinositol deacylase
MRRRPSGSTTEEEDDIPISDVVPIKEKEDKEESLRKSIHLDPKDKRRPSRAAAGPKPAWKTTTSKKDMPSEKEMAELRLSKDISRDATKDIPPPRRRCQMRNPWSCSWLTLGTSLTALALILCIFQSFTTRQLDPKGAEMSWMASAFVRFPDFDTEHTRFATKYSLHLYREMGIDDEDPKV